MHGDDIALKSVESTVLQHSQPSGTILRSCINHVDGTQGSGISNSRGKFLIIHVGILGANNA